MSYHYTMKDNHWESFFIIVEQQEIPYGYPNAGLYRSLLLTNTGTYCPHCRAYTEKIKDQKYKSVHSGTFNGTPVIDFFYHRRFSCSDCNRSFRERLDWLKPYQQVTEDAHLALLMQTADMTFQSVGEAHGLTGQTVGRKVRRHFQQQFQRRFKGAPLYLGIDEISLAKGKGSYRLVIYDLTVPWRPQLTTLEDSRKQEDVIETLKQFPHPERVIAVSMDMWRPYKVAIEKIFPHALIVVDAFHLIQAATRSFDEVRKQVQQGCTKEQRLELKRAKEILTTPEHKRKPDDQQCLEQLLENHVHLWVAHELYQMLRSLYHRRDFESALDHLAQWEREVISTGLSPFIDLLKTVWNWLIEILNRFICRISNAKTEGKNNQLRTMNNQGFNYSLLSLMARIWIKEEQQALKGWRLYQKKLERKTA